MTLTRQRYEPKIVDLYYQNGVLLNKKWIHKDEISLRERLDSNTIVSFIRNEPY